MMRKRLLLLTVLMTALCNCWAQGPNNSGTYYKNANGLKGAALKTALAGIINPHHSLGYDGLYEAYKKTDTRPDGYVRDWYSNVTNYRHVTDKAGSYKNEGDCYNREHTVPQSWFESHGSGAIIKCDVVHVVPSDGKINGMRSNNPFGEVSTIKGQSANGYSKWGPCKTAGYTNTVFEPNDEIKGDIARIYFYMATCYESLAPSWGNSVFTGSKHNPFSQWTYDMLLRWAKQDPIDEVEIARNNAVYETQQNRNPFVDYPGLEDYVWGSKIGQAFSYDNYDGAGSGTEITTVAMPVISPDEGTYYESVDVTITCATEGADIYYTTDGGEASEQSIPYEGTFTLTENATIKAVAIKDGKRSVQAIASYFITSGGSDVPVDSEMRLNSEFFSCEGGGTINKQTTEDFVGNKNGITVVYALGSGQQRYVTSSEIRVYTGNTLTVSVGQGALEEIEFTVGKNTSALNADTGSINGYTWTGNASRIVFTSGGNLSLASMKVKVAGGTTAVYRMDMSNLTGQRVVYNLRGQRVAHPTKGMYIVDGKKIMME